MHQFQVYHVEQPIFIPKIKKNKMLESKETNCFTPFLPPGARTWLDINWLIFFFVIIRLVLAFIRTTICSCCYGRCIACTANIFVLKTNKQQFHRKYFRRRSIRFSLISTFFPHLFIHSYVFVFILNHCLFTTIMLIKNFGGFFFYLREHRKLKIIREMLWICCFLLLIILVFV